MTKFGTMWRVKEESVDIGKGEKKKKKGFTLAGKCSE